MGVRIVTGAARERPWAPECYPALYLKAHGRPLTNALAGAALAGAALHGAAMAGAVLTGAALAGAAV